MLCPYGVQMYNVMLALLLGFIVGLIAAFFGIGGGVLFVPILIIIFNLPPTIAVGTSLLAIFITSTSSTIAYARQKKIYYKLGLILEMASVPGAVIGAYITTIIPGEYLKKVFSIFLVFVAINIMHRGEKRSKVENTSDKHLAYPGRKLWMALLFSFLAGLLSATLGIGGGVLKTPIMILILELPIHNAIATSCFMITITSLTGLSQHIMYGHVIVTYGLSLGLGAIGGAQAGAILSKHTKPRTLQKLFAVLLIVVAVKLFL